MAKGQISDAVKSLQNNLKTLGYLSSTADGVFGTGTEAAVKAFQKNHGLTQDGLVGSGTRAQITAAVKAKEKLQSDPKPSGTSESGNVNKSENNSITTEGINFTKSHEGCSLKPYNKGQTIGYGMDIANYPDVKINYQTDGTITKEEADRLFGIVYNSKAEKLNDYLRKNNYSLDKYQFASAVDLIYNRGLNDMTKEVINAMANNDNSKVAFLLSNDFDYKYAMKYLSMSSSEARAYCDRNPGLVNRRKQEINMANNKTFNV